MDQKPSPGRIVHFVLVNGPHEGAHRPAIIVEVLADVVHLQVFSLGNEDGFSYLHSPCVVKDVPYSTDVPGLGTWHWPERV